MDPNVASRSSAGYSFVNFCFVKSGSGAGCGTAPTPPSCSDLSVPTCNSQWTAYDIKAAQWDARTL